VIRSALVVGGAGFVGSRLVRSLLGTGAQRIDVVDNLLSAQPENVPDDPRVSLVVGSIADDRVLAGIDDAYDGNTNCANNLWLFNAPFGNVNRSCIQP